MRFSVTIVLTASLIGIILATLVGGRAARWGFPMPSERKRLGTIDGLRGYLALLVMVHHFATYILISVDGGEWRDAPVPVLQSFGAGSVTLFFMITGALFFPKTWRGIGGNDWAGMYFSRLFRILPLQVLTVSVITVIALARVDGRFGTTLISLPVRFALWLTSYSQPMLFGYHGTAQINAFVLWSLWAEWKFYFLVLPVVAMAMSVLGERRGRWLVPLTLLTCGTAFHYSNSETLHRLNYAVFACGMFTVLVRSSRVAPIFRMAPAALIAGTGLVLCVALSPTPDDALPLSGYALFFTCVVCGNRFFGLLITRGALVLGEISFSIYMLHGVLLNVVFVSGNKWVTAIPVEVRPWLLVPLMPTITVISILTYLFVERPMIVVGRQVGGRWRQSTVAQADNSSVAVAP